jgi:hypothetical protein
MDAMQVLGLIATAIASAGGAYLAIRVELAVLRTRIDGHERELQRLASELHSVRGAL